MDYVNLPTIAALSDCVSIINMGDCKAVRVIHPNAQALISLHGAHLLSFQPTGQADLIWMSEDAIFDNKAAIRGGVPVCWPWFGRIAAPAHGFARTSEWTLAQHRENDRGVIIELTLQDSAPSHAIWPHKFFARLLIEIADTITLTLEVENTDSSPWTFSGALHTYLNVGDITQTKVTGMGPTYQDSLQQGKICTGNEELMLTDTIDRVYTAPVSPIVLFDPVLDRHIEVRNQGDNSAVLWNPWQQGAKAMADMHDTGYQTMLCIESTLHAASLEQGKKLEPGEKHQLITHLSVK
ncbi:aldose epimerase [Vibrio sp. qd031]|uniref:D-hexose-6-phosphate mutarotase n=1 Tax=Vibrio sp. qd031 TaxID=1603038 RepID=UPI000A0F4217|nr:D-hexose-6-phosphate mutarotase [Vibrio sp. qd031]ORT49427.1 aldose epimerase [Vibrio sp. qd031]